MFFTQRHRSKPPCQRRFLLTPSLAWACSWPPLHLLSAATCSWLWLDPPQERPTWPQAHVQVVLAPPALPRTAVRQPYFSRLQICNPSCLSSLLSLPKCLHWILDRRPDKHKWNQCFLLLPILFLNHEAPQLGTMAN